ncbi:MAG TPA: metal-dependent transcriptional regulator [Candidatus Eremiobacteraceae bacterium]|nr:metal-dependent transcriptional regulator [Candidatus Eremiobacteraceae bacterium]
MVNTGGDRWPDRARQDYLKSIYLAGGGEAAKAADVARRLGVSRASVSKRVRELERGGLVERDKRGVALRLTAAGRRVAISVIRRHRIVETFLHGSLGVPLDRLHAEAERIEHAVSDDVAMRLERLMRYPELDPHGDAIPDARGRLVRVTDEPLSMATIGAVVQVSRIDDRVPAVVRALERAGVLPGAKMRVVARRAGETLLRIGTRVTPISAKASNAVRVRRVAQNAKRTVA